MSRGFLIIFCIVAVTVFMRVKCGTTPADEGNVVNSAEDMKLSNGDISGWSEEDGSYMKYTASELYVPINGGAATYDNNGLIEGILQTLKGSEAASVEIFVMDFGTVEKSDEMFQNIVNTKVNSQVSVSDYSTEKVVGDESISGGLNVYAHFDKYYFELHFTGYTDNQVAKDEAGLFISVYDSWLN